jgi:hypothetical protein
MLGRRALPRRGRRFVARHRPDPIEPADEDTVGRHLARAGSPASALPRCLSVVRGPTGRIFTDSNVTAGGPDSVARISPTETSSTPDRPEPSRHGRERAGGGLTVRGKTRPEPQARARLPPEWPRLAYVSRGENLATACPVTRSSLKSRRPYGGAARQARRQRSPGPPGSPQRSRRVAVSSGPPGGPVRR